MLKYHDLYSQHKNHECQIPRQKAPAIYKLICFWEDYLMTTVFLLQKSAIHRNDGIFLRWAQAHGQLLR